MTVWQQGDVVRLKSGGPKMTVHGKAAQTSSSYICIWFEGTKQVNGQFGSETLTAAEPEGNAATAPSQTSD